ncbi:uncharacterized protein LOC111410870 [Olea europaea var. sylvestris]|uniref:uncharacterized protein LOC111410870 n=1 Tax=Olea europaea var. sylvestris TaxID=158386 RepID=UPI000C1CEC86|nr:uncharacterized protein LOC111410870 [Olea europaea var. sylvestris]
MRVSGRKPFRFEKMSLKVEGFEERVWTWLATYDFQGSPSYVLDQKLKALKWDLKRLNEQVVGNPNWRKNRCFLGMKELDRREESRWLVGEERQRYSVKGRVGEISVDGGDCFVPELKERDKCIKSFHRVANFNRRNNFITLLEIDEVTYEDPHDIGT